MLYSILIGGNTSATNDWILTNDNYDNTFISNTSIRQRIKLGKNVKKTLSDCHSFHEVDEDSVTPVYSYTEYKLPERIFISNNNKNMNLNLLNFFSTEKDVMDNHVDDDIAYITLSPDLIVVRYENFSNKIVQTYHGKDYKGIAVKFSSEINLCIMSITVKDVNTNTFKNISVFINNEHNLEVSITPITCEAYLKDINEMKINPKGTYFVLDLKEEMPTYTYITNTKCEEYLLEALNMRGVEKYNIITIGRDGFRDKDLFKGELVDQRIRAVTSVGVKLNPSFLKENNILYVFNYDIRNDEIKCIKSK